MLGVVMLNFVMPSVVAPLKKLARDKPFILLAVKMSDEKSFNKLVT
jgi:hypothetical protein